MMESANQSNIEKKPDQNKPCVIRDLDLSDTHSLRRFAKADPRAVYPGDYKKRARPDSPHFKQGDPNIKPRP